ncbi:MAG: HIT domain-containing protein [Candidatus Saccharimonadales bacterium]
MIGTRHHKQISRYEKHLKAKPAGACAFCINNPDDDNYSVETKSFKILRNIFPYNTWDLQDVTDHLLIVPKKHIVSLNNLTANEAIEYVDLLGSYESRGYNVYSRAPASGMKSVSHQHTHLIKTSGKPKRVLLYTKNRYLRVIV